MLINKNKGSAILSALFIMTLVAITTTTLTLQLKNNIDTTRLLLNTQKLQLDGAITRFWAMNFLSHPEENHFGHTPGQSSYIQKNSRFSVELIDLNAKFNLNNLKITTSKTTFYRLAKHLLEDESNKKAYPITAALTYYIKTTPMVSLSECRLVPDIDPADLKLLMPYLTALPAETQVNINTAPEELLMAMAAGKDTVQYMEKLISARGKNGIDSINADIKAILNKLSIKPDDVTTESAYFLSIGQIKQENQIRMIYSLLHRVKNKDNTYTVDLVHETWNTD
ncbi:MAG: type II secretion system protein GspK [Legionella sp.]|nr:type II secretion system protein GspK [Legionella sp.]